MRQDWQNGLEELARERQRSRFNSERRIFANALMGG